MSNDTDNTIDEVDCADGVTRPESECVCCADGDWYPKEECVRCGDGEWRPRCECDETCDGDWYPTSELIELASGEWVHQDDDRIVCRHDGEYDWIEDCCEIDGDWYHADECCRCESCNRAVVTDDSYTGPGEASLCQRCYEDYTRSCDNCGECCWSDDVAYSESRGAYLCEPCHAECDSRIIRDYGNKSANHMRPESRDAILYGIELEVEAKGDREDAAERVLGKLGDDYCVLKHDGSLGPEGFEIVTRRDSVAVHKKHWDKFFADDPAKYLSSWTNGRCGMHVHVSKAPLSQLQLGKMLCFLNDPFNEEMVVKIAGRRSERWSKIEKKKVSDVKHGHERYVALNITNKTAEFRIFKGTLNRLAFYKNLEFCEALVEFTGPAQRSIMDATSWKVFCEWLPHKSYPNLYDFLVRKRFILNDRRSKRKAG